MQRPLSSVRRLDAETPFISKNTRCRDRPFVINLLNSITRVGAIFNTFQSEDYSLRCAEEPCTPRLYAKKLNAHPPSLAYSFKNGCIPTKTPNINELLVTDARLKALS